MSAKKNRQKLVRRAERLRRGRALAGAEALLPESASIDQITVSGESPAQAIPELSVSSAPDPAAVLTLADRARARANASGILGVLRDDFNLPLPPASESQS